MYVIKTAVGVLLGFLLLIFAFQNTQSVSVSLFTWSFGAVPLFLVIILVFLVGFVSGRLTGWAKTIFRKK